MIQQTQKLHTNIKIKIKNSTVARQQILENENCK